MPAKPKAESFSLLEPEGLLFAGDLQEAAVHPIDSGAEAIAVVSLPAEASSSYEPSRS